MHCFGLPNTSVIVLAENLSFPFITYRSFGSFSMTIFVRPSNVFFDIFVCFLSRFLDHSTSLLFYGPAFNNRGYSCDRWCRR